MEKLSAVIVCLFLTVGAVTAQRAQSSERLLPQWLTGIIAVTGFIFLSFVVFLVKKAWCEESGRRTNSVAEFSGSNGSTCDTHMDAVRSKDDVNAYENLVIDSSDDKVTAM